MITYSSKAFVAAAIKWFPGALCGVYPVFQGSCPTILSRCFDLRWVMPQVKAQGEVELKPLDFPRQLRFLLDHMSSFLLSFICSLVNLFIQPTVTYVI